MLTRVSQPMRILISYAIVWMIGFLIWAAAGD